MFKGLVRSSARVYPKCMGDLWTIEPVTLTYDAPKAFTGTPEECWTWLVEFGRKPDYDHVGELQYVLDGCTDDPYPWGGHNLYSIRARYDTTFERYTGAMLWFLMYPAGGKDDLPEEQTPYGRYRRQFLKDARKPKPEVGRMMWD